jgi:hypothetical protein
MRDDGVVPAGGIRTAGRVGASVGCSLVASALALAIPAAADTFHGSAEVQYQSVDRTAFRSNLDTWNKTLQLDYASALPGTIALTSSFRFVEQTVAKQSDRVRVPEASVRLAHRNFGFSTSLRPTETRDSRGLIFRRQDLSMNAYAQQDKLPSLSATWVRSRLEPSPLSQGSSTVSRSIGTQYALPHVTFRAGYGDRFLDDATQAGPRISENHLGAGSTAQFQVGRAPISLQYDVSQSHNYPSGSASQESRAHLAGFGTQYTFDPKTSASLSYNYRNTLLVGVPGSTNQEHNGSLSIGRAINPVFELGAGAGVRNAVLGGGRSLTERFVDATATAQGQARPGWRLTGAVTSSVNWLPDEVPRPSQSIQSTTTMRLAKGLDLRGDLSVTSAKLVVVPPETTAFSRQMSMQSGLGLAATPLRTVYLDASMTRSHTGQSLTNGLTARSYSVGLRLNPMTALQLNGRWGLSNAPGSRATTEQASLQWTASGSFQLSGTYGRAHQEVSFPTLALTSLQESFSGNLTVRLAEQLNASASYTESNRHQPNQLRQYSLNLVQRFGR